MGKSKPTYRPQTNVNMNEVLYMIYYGHWGERFLDHGSQSDSEQGVCSVA